MKSVNPTTKTVLLTLGITGFVAASILMPGLPKVLAPFLKKQYKKWGHFNRRKLKAEIKRLKTTGVIEEISQDGEMLFRLTNKGKSKLFKYKLEELSLKYKRWDGKWRLVIYDIPKGKKMQADAFRNLLKKMNFLKIQKSVYLTPYDCKNEIEFLKALYTIEEEVTVLIVTGLEAEQAYRQYFGL